MVQIMDAVAIILDVASSLIILVISMTSSANVVNPKYFADHHVEKIHRASEQFLREQKRK